MPTRLRGILLCARMDGRGARRSNKIRILSVRVSSKRLADAERKIKASGSLIPKLPNPLPSRRIGRDVGKAWKIRRIQIVSKVKARRSNRSLITQSDPDRMRSIIVIALQVRVVVKAEILIRLVKAT